MRDTCEHGHANPTLCLECVTEALEEMQDRLIETQLQLIGANDVLIRATMAANVRNWNVCRDVLLAGPRTDVLMNEKPAVVEPPPLIHTFGKTRH